MAAADVALLDFLGSSLQSVAVLSRDGHVVGGAHFAWLIDEADP